MEIKNKERVLLLALLFVFFACIFRFIPGFIPDFDTFVGWCMDMHRDGFRYIYTHSKTNYLPFYQYILYLYIKVAGNEFNIAWYIKELRLFTLAFEIIGLWYIYKWTDKKTSFIVLVLISLLNIGFSYNTIVWGQVDGIFSAFVFIAFYYGYKQDMFWSSVFIVLALNAKLQAIIFVPIWLLLFLNNLIDKKSLKAFLFPVLTLVATQLLIILPFLTKAGQVQALWHVVKGSEGFYPRICMDASNIWYLLLPKDVIANVPDYSIYKLGLSYKQLGLVMFFVTSALALLPIVLDVYRTYRLKMNAMQNRERLWLSAALIAICFFFFNTQMHERYCHPAIVFLTAYAFYSRRFGIYILFSVAYFLNLELVLSDTHYPHPHYEWFVRPNIAWMFAIIILLMFVRLYTIKNKPDKVV